MGLQAGFGLIGSKQCFKKNTMSDNDRDKFRFNVFLASVVLHSQLGTCDRLRTAAGAVKNKRLEGVGYNGSVSGLAHCDDVGHLIVDGHCLRTRHGEVNLISNTERENLRGAQIIIIGTPCIECVKDLAHEGVAEIHYVGSYSNAQGTEHSQQICEEKRIKLIQHHIDYQELFQEVFDNLAKKGGVLERAGYRLKVVKEEI